MTKDNEQISKAPDHITVNGKRVEVVFQRPYIETLQSFVDSIAQAGHAVGVADKAKNEGKS